MAYIHLSARPQNEYEICNKYQYEKWNFVKLTFENREKCHAIASVNFFVIKGTKITQLLLCGKIIFQKICCSRDVSSDSASMILQHFESSANIAILALETETVRKTANFPSPDFNSLPLFPGQVKTPLILSQQESTKSFVYEV